jgi:hypothetical protein
MLVNPELLAALLMVLFLGTVAKPIPYDGDND